MLELLFTPARTWSSTACILGKVTIDKSPFAFSSELIDFPNMTANIPLMAIFPNELRGNCSACLPPYENNALSSRVLWANAAPFQNVMLILHFRLRKEAQSMFQIPSPKYILPLPCHPMFEAYLLSPLHYYSTPGHPSRIGQLHPISGLLTPYRSLSIAHRII
jgi:hypothetical protein